MNKLTPFLWFNDNAEQAAAFYLSVFPNARKLNELRAGDAQLGPWQPGELGLISIEIEGQQVSLLNGGPGQSLSEAFSFTVRCSSQAELDGYWNKFLDAGGQESVCGWLKDHFGVSWQIVPDNILELVSNPNGMAAMMTMKKFDIAALEAAAQQD